MYKNKLRQNENKKQRKRYKEKTQKSTAGITLIALVISIIVLLILAGVSISLLTGDRGVLTQATDSTITNIESRVDEEVRLAVQGCRLIIANKTAQDYSWSAINDVKKGTSGADKSEILGLLESDLTTSSGYAIEEKEEGTKIEILYTGEDYKKTTNNNSAKISYTLDVGLHSVGYSTGKATGSETTYTAYTVGQTVTLGEGANAEDFYVIKYSDENTETVELITAKNVETTGYTQSNSANPVAVDRSDEYALGKIYMLAENYVTALKERIGVTENIHGRLMTLDEAQSLGLELSDGLGAAVRNVGEGGFLLGTFFWLGDPWYNYQNLAYYISPQDDGIASYVDDWDGFWTSRCGLRPVISISKDNIKR